MKTLNCSSDPNLHWCAVNDEIPSLNTNLSSINITATKSMCPEVYNTPPYPICDGMLVICINKTSCDMCSYMHLVRRPYLILVKENENETICPTPSNTSLITICPTPTLPNTTICPTPPLQTITICPTTSHTSLPTATIFPTPPLPTTTICQTPPLQTITICPTTSHAPLPTTTICPTPPLLTTTICPTPSNTPLLCFNDNCIYEACKTLANTTCNGRNLANTTSFPTMLFLVMGILLHMTLIGT